MTPYTPAAIAHIKNCAPSYPAAKIAHDLGWDVETLRKLAALHNIKLREPESVFPMPEYAEHHIVGRVGVEIGISTSLEQIIASLPLRQAQVLSILKREIDGRFIPASEIAERIGVQSKSVGSIAQNVRAKLRPSQWWLDSHSSRAGGGYRLVTRS